MLIELAQSAQCDDVSSLELCDSQARGALATSLGTKPSTSAAADQRPFLHFFLAKREVFELSLYLFAYSEWRHRLVKS